MCASGCLPLLCRVSCARLPDPLCIAAGRGCYTVSSPPFCFGLGRLRPARALAHFWLGSFRAFRRWLLAMRSPSSAFSSITPSWSPGSCAFQDLRVLTRGSSSQPLFSECDYQRLLSLFLSSFGFIPSVESVNAFWTAALSHVLRFAISSCCLCFSCRFPLFFISCTSAIRSFPITSASYFLSGSLHLLLNSLCTLQFLYFSLIWRCRCRLPISVQSPSLLS